METTVDSGMCRCCASEGLFKDVNTTYHWMGEDEVYADMLHFCFDITLASAEGQNNGGICEVCITQLRNAANFKKQVQHTEEQFKKRLAQVNSYKPEVIKVEMSVEDGAESDNNLSEDYQSGPEFEVPIKEESPEPKPKKRAAKATTSKAKKVKTDSGETSTKRVGRVIKLETTLTKPLELKFISKSKTTVRNNSDLSEAKKNQHNLSIILLNSNANPIRCKDSFGYGCAFCPKQFPQPTNLKKHFLEEHNSDRLIKYMSNAEKQNVVMYETKKITLDRKTNFSTFITIRPQRQRMTRKKKATDAAKKTSELDFHFENIKLILMYSNATPIRSRIGSKYACGYCTNQYSTPAELKDHTLYTHVTDKPECLRILSLSKYVVYLDVTDLECLMCDARLKKLADLMHHLKNYHDEPFHMDIKNHIIPFDFTTSKMQCVDCCKQFEVFEDLQEHMNSHYKNYSCELCDEAWFVNRSLMMDHKKTVHFL